MFGPPEGRARWTLALLAGEMVRLTGHATLSRATVGCRLAENDLKPWQLVLDNLSTHTAAALYDTFEPGEARRILRKLEFHYVPKHASWFNMVEIEIGVLKQQCLSRRIAERETLAREIAAWQTRRNEAAACIQWMFTTEQARNKLGRVYRPLAQARQDATKEYAS